MTKVTELSDASQTIELLEERLDVAKQDVVTGRVFIETKVETQHHVVEALLRQDEISVERVPVGAFVDAAPPVREEDGVLIISIVEEQLVVQTRLVLKEEVHVRRTSRSDLVRRTIPLRSETATVTRVDEPLPQDPSSPDP
jgi:uncharacterized protein (TIGR02271 family)